MPPRRKQGGGGGGGGGGARGGGISSPSLAATSDEQKLFNLITQNNYVQVIHHVNMKMWTVKNQRELLGKALVAALYVRGSYKITQFLVNDLGVNVLTTYEDETREGGQSVQPLAKALDVQDCKTVIAMLRSLEGHIATAGGLTQMRIRGVLEGPMLAHVVQRGMADTVKFILEEDPEGSLQLLTTSNRAENLLYLATHFGQKDVLACMAHTLRNHPGYVAAIAEFKYTMGHSLLHFAVMAGKLDCFQWLIRDTGGGLQRDLHFPAASDPLPLHEAASVGDVKILRHLIAEVGMGVDITHGANNKTALHYAAGGFSKDKGDVNKEAKKYLNCVKYLVEEEKASTSLRDALGQDAIDHARKSENQLVIDYLEQVEGIGSAASGRKPKAKAHGSGGGDSGGNGNDGDKKVAALTEQELNAKVGATNDEQDEKDDDEMDSSSEDDKDDEDEDHPDELTCPISFVLMTNPVVASDGHTYEKEALEQHVAYAASKNYQLRSPMTNEPMTPVYFDNLNLRCLVHEHLERQAREKQEKAERRAERLRMRELIKAEGNNGKESGAQTKKVKRLAGVKILENKLSFLKKNAAAQAPTAAAAGLGGGKKKEQDEMEFIERVCESTEMRQILEEDFKQELKSQSKSLNELVQDIIRIDSTNKKNLQLMIDKFQAMALQGRGHEAEDKAAAVSSEVVRPKKK